MLDKCAAIWDSIRDKKPLVHCISNYVTLNDVANILLAGGASPAMVEHPDEAGSFAAISDSIYINLGTLTDQQEKAMLKAVESAERGRIPVVVDPVACGVIPRKTEVLTRLAKAGNINVVKGNGAEIKSLAGLNSLARGVDSLDSGEGLQEACCKLSWDNNWVVAATGQVDVVAYNNNIACIKNGTDLMEKITGAGCMAGAVIAACIGAFPENQWLAAITALCAFNIAGEKAAEQSGDKPATYRTMLVDELYLLKGSDLLRGAKVEWIS